MSLATGVFAAAAHFAHAAARGPQPTKGFSFGDMPWWGLVAAGISVAALVAALLLLVLGKKTPPAGPQPYHQGPGAQPNVPFEYLHTPGETTLDLPDEARTTIPQPGTFAPPTAYTPPPTGQPQVYTMPAAPVPGQPSSPGQPVPPTAAQPPQPGAGYPSATPPSQPGPAQPAQPAQPSAAPPRQAAEGSGDSPTGQGEPSQQ
ncbi:hypothetical protein [Buchananella hordeovulneris]|uniref:hypothetical protein n=1 Tax=Buchananella hordeovulneris TaxID=52770 RepID=UPI0026DC6BFA|nr:hypothetical protein [Buchananella hordeovulneris]MDO5079976.1 hypothetical protein [Buchananella hordeovulneris]